jgi:hypothetical protein
VAKAGACTPAEVKVGQIRPAPSGVHSAWVQCPLASANQIAGVGRVRMGWMVARATLLTQRPLQCFRCLERGHVRERCTSQVDRSGACYRCGKPGHVARACTAQNGSCPACQVAGLPFGHKIEAPACKAGANKKRGAAENPTPSSRLQRSLRHQGGTCQNHPSRGDSENRTSRGDDGNRPFRGNGGDGRRSGGKGTPSTSNTERALPRIVEMVVLSSTPDKGAENMEVEEALEDGNKA